MEERIGLDFDGSKDVAQTVMALAYGVASDIVADCCTIYKLNMSYRERGRL